MSCQKYVINIVKPLTSGFDQNDKNFNLLERRSGAASIVLNQSTLWVVGGEDGYQDLRLVFGGFKITYPS